MTRAKPPTAQPLVERTNALTVEEFLTKYMPPATKGEGTTENATTQDPPISSGTEQVKSIEPPLDVYSAASISDSDLEACLDLIEQTSGDAYRASPDGWSRRKKRKEMKLPDMKYLILRDFNDEGNAEHIATPDKPTPKERDETVASPVSTPQPSDVLGFLSFMVTYEDSQEVVYCYEIHLSPRARGRGVGSVLMKRMEAIGRAVGLEKAMLTVFKSNDVACRFYERLGYVLDEYSPRPRKLRNGTVKEVDYMILSKRLRD
jgi:ribosomal protein S18 acetylase RimI-like enzyme